MLSPGRIRAIRSLDLHQRLQTPLRSTRTLSSFTTLPKTPLTERPRLRPIPTLVNGGEAESSSMARARFSPLHQLSEWSGSVRNVLLIQKRDDDRANAAMGKLLHHLESHYPHLNIIVEPHTTEALPEHQNLYILDGSSLDGSPLRDSVDLVITVGGDGTILHTSNLFGDGECPPVLSFSMGSLGFLMPFHIDAMASVLQTALTGPVAVLQRMRLSCTPLDKYGEVLKCPMQAGEAGWQVMNEVTIHRGRHPHLTVVDAFFDDEHLTEAVADGLLLSTPTGSTAYSLSAGGPISHPDTDAFLLTPIAPRSLSFRTVILPGRGMVQLKISPLARSPAELSFDGREVCLLHADESVVIKKSPYPIPCIERSDRGSASGWVKDINSLLQFNTGFRNKSLSGHGIV